MTARPTYHRPVNRSPAEDRTYRGVVYDSKAERQRAVELDLMVRSGRVLCWFRQVPIQLGEDFRNRVDFIVVGTTEDGDDVRKVWAEEVKGFDTPAFRNVVRLWTKYGPVDLAVLRPKGTSWTVERVEGGGKRSAFD